MLQQLLFWHRFVLFLAQISGCERYFSQNNVVLKTALKEIKR